MQPSLAAVNGRRKPFVYWDADFPGTSWEGKRMFANCRSEQLQQGKSWHAPNVIES